MQAIRTPATAQRALLGRSLRAATRPTGILRLRKVGIGPHRLGRPRSAGSDPRARPPALGDNPGCQRAEGPQRAAHCACTAWCSEAGTDKTVRQGSCPGAHAYALTIWSRLPPPAAVQLTVANAEPSPIDQGKELAAKGKVALEDFASKVVGKDVKLQAPSLDVDLKSLVTW